VQRDPANCNSQWLGLAGRNRRDYGIEGIEIPVGMAGLNNPIGDPPLSCHAQENKFSLLNLPNEAFFEANLTYLGQELYISTFWGENKVNGVTAIEARA